MRFLLKIIIKILFRVKTANFEQIKNSGRVIIMPNHVSLLDGFFLYLFLPKETVFVVNTQVAKRFSFFVGFANHVTIDQLNPYAIKDIIHYINKGIPLVLFPEGRISSIKGIMKIYDGVGFMALKTGATVFPLAINGLEYSKFSGIKDRVKTRWFPPVQLYVDAPLTIEIEKERSIKEQRREASDRIFLALQRALYKSRSREKVNLFNELLEASEVHGANKNALEDMKAKVSYKKLILSAYVLGGKFRSILGLGDENIGVLLPNAIAHVSTLFGLFYINKTPAILNFSAGNQTILDCAETANIKVVITSKEFVEKGGFAPLLEQLAKRYNIIYLEDVRTTVGTADKIGGLLNSIRKKQALSAANNRLILFTSGSESKPKGVVLSHSNIYNNIIQSTCTLDFCSMDKMFNALPMFHSFGLTAGTLLPLMVGARVFLYPTPLHFKVIPELIYEVNATVVLGTSMFLSMYGKYAHTFDFQSVRYAIVGAEKLKDDVRELWNEKFGLRILEGYGCTETAPVLALNTPLNNKKGSVGKLVPGLEYKIEPVEGIAKGGRLIVKGPNVMEGYLKYGQGFEPADEWYDTGDIVTDDSKGFITITARLKRFAKISGEMVSLNQVEELAQDCFGPDFSYAAINLNDAKFGEKILLITTGPNLSLKEFKSYLISNQYSNLLSPDEILYRDEIDTLGSGKIDYVTLQELFSEIS